MTTLNRACGSERALGPIPPRSSAFFASSADPGRIDGVLVGSVNVNLMGDGVGEFGMLVADRKSRGEGIGSALVQHAEKWAREHACLTMRLGKYPKFCV
ncbi:MAG: GNAT family N-acetyltransferase [Terrimicrobiaceae bacterium]